MSRFIAPKLFLQDCRQRRYLYGNGYRILGGSGKWGLIQPLISNSRWYGSGGTTIWCLSISNSGTRSAIIRSLSPSKHYHGLVSKYISIDKREVACFLLGAIASSDVKMPSMISAGNTSCQASGFVWTAANAQSSTSGRRKWQFSVGVPAPSPPHEIPSHLSREYGVLFRRGLKTPAQLLQGGYPDPWIGSMLWTCKRSFGRRVGSPNPIEWPSDWIPSRAECQKMGSSGPFRRNIR